MNKLFSPENSLEVLAAVFSLLAVLGTLQTFVIGGHFVIPTMVLFLAILFGNLARFGLQGQRWAKHLLFWLFAVLACHAFFALFHAADARPGAFFGAAFYPAYGGFLVIVGGLCWRYAQTNRLFRS